MLLSLVNCAIVRTAQLTSESNILFISSCSAELKEIVTPVGSFQFVRRRSLLHSQQLVQTLSCCWHFPLWSVWILHVSGCVFCDIKNVNNSTLFWQAQCRQIRKVTSRAQKFSWNKEVWGEKRTYLEVLMDSTLTKDIIQYIVNLHCPSASEHSSTLFRHCKAF